MGARAFVRGGELYVGDDVGALGAAAGRATVAHELTHLAQQRGCMPRCRPKAARRACCSRPRPSASSSTCAVTQQHRSRRRRCSTPAPRSAIADVVADSQQLMRDLVERGLAQPDGSGGVIFGAVAPLHRRSRRAATRGARAARRAARRSPNLRVAICRPPANWNRGDTWGHGLGSALANDMLTIGSSFLGLSDDVVRTERDRLTAEDRHFAQDQTRRAYREMRLEHLQQRELRQLHDRQDRGTSRAAITSPRRC